jgi:FG-GAP-like repeat
MTASMLGLAGTAVAATAPGHEHRAGTPSSFTGTTKTEQEATQALRKAKKTGENVPVSTLTTPTSATVANPRGDFTLTQSPQPVRAWRNGTWKSLDARLHVNPDHTWSPNVSTGELRLSGGGAGPLATMTATGHALSLSWPTRLPAPTVSGAVATYRSVLKDVDLVVTVSPQGGFSHTLVVRSAAAAADPRLARLTMATRGNGLSVTADAAGSLKATAAANGAPVFTAPAPTMWDSATTPHTAPIKVTVDHSRGSITLTPDRGLLAGASTVFPVYIDPTWLPQYVASTRDAWAQVDTLKRNVAHWDPAELRSGFCEDDTCDPPFTGRSYVQMSVPPQLRGAHIVSSGLNLTVASAPYSSCTGAPTPGIELWSTGAISPSTTWQHGPSWNKRIGVQTPPACAGQGVTFPITAFVQSHAQKANSLTFGIRAASETDKDGWKGFHVSSLIMSTTYNNAPDLPSDPATSPGGPCQTGSPSATLIGNDDVTFQVVATDPDGGALGTEFVVKDYDGGVVYDSGDPATSGIVSASGTAVRLVLQRSQIQGWHPDGATAAHTYSWYTRTSDGDLYSPTTGTGSAGSPCTFTYDPTEPPAPSVTVSTGASGTVGTLGQTATVTLAPCAEAVQIPPAACTGTAPHSYTYQVNSDTSQTVTVTGGVQTVQIPLHHVGPNTVTAFATSAAGNRSDEVLARFGVDPPVTPYADGDIDGDGHADLLTAGPDTDPGLWLARGDGAGGLSTPTNIGASGLGSGSAADWNGTQVLHGDFTGDRVQDVLAYHPTGANAGGGTLLYGNGDDLPLNPNESQSLFSGTFADYTLNADGDNPTQLVAAGNASLTDTAIPDLIGITGDATNGYQLDLYTSCCRASGYTYTQTLAGPADSPDGDGDWGDFSLVTAQPASAAVLFAMKKSTGELWESTNPAQDPATPIGTAATAGGHWTKINVPWGADAAPALVSGDINTAGAIELWAQAGITGTPYVLNDTTLEPEQSPAG